jgi:mRNA interferase RelE/StbE
VTEPQWDLVVARPARRTIDRLPQKLAIAVLAFMLGPLLNNPHRVGKALRGDLAGLYSARIGSYRLAYESDDVARAVRVVYISHRADIYRPR